MLRNCPAGLLVARGVSIASFATNSERVDHRDAVWEVWEEDVYHVDGITELTDRPVVDIGAHIGSFSILCASRGARVLALEPFTEAYEMLRKNVERNALESVILTCQSAAAPAGIPEVSIERYEDTGMGITTPGGRIPALRPLEIAERVEMLAPQFHEGTPIALLKVDIEGFEHSLFACPEMREVLVPRCERIAIETHPGPALGGLIEMLLATHHVEAFGRPEAGGMIYAHRY